MPEPSKCTIPNGRFNSFCSAASWMWLEPERPMVPTTTRRFLHSSTNCWKVWIGESFFTQSCQLTTLQP